LDADELDEALDQGVITTKEHAAVCQEAQRLVELVREERLEILRITAEHRQRLLPLLRHR
jgi:predicted RNA-binding protein associated with RNAse of E/G family